jgi:glutamate racemase
VLHEARLEMPQENFLYYADSANVPYGSKDPETILNLVLKSVNDMTSHPLKAIVIACNTATSAAVAALRAQYDIPIIGMEPAIKPAIIDGDPRKTLVLATAMTLKLNKYKDLVSRLGAEEKVDGLPMQELVDFAEEFDFDSNALRKYLKAQFDSIRWDDYRSVVLGCTHFIYFRSILRELIPEHVMIIDGNAGTVKRLTALIKPAQSLGDPTPILCMLSGLEVSSEVLIPYLNALKGEGIAELLR